MSTAPERLCKQPSESLKFRMKFGNRLGASETISSITSITSEKLGGGVSDLALTSSGIESGTNVTVWIASGTSGQTYNVEFKIMTTASQGMEGDGQLRVKD